tara:strand:- start:454 stop:1311 length:858 start_codon:yes stop_codon:yes gene_type:complete
MKFEETLSNDHLRKFLSYCEKDFNNVMDHFVYGKSPYKLIRTLKLYIEKLDNNELITYERRKGFEEKFKGQLKPTYLDHSMLDEICKDHDTYDIEDCVLAILAWGQIYATKNNFIPAWKSLNKPENKSFLEDIRIGRSCNRKEIYQKFTDYRLSGELKGLDTPYFTKLIYFLMRGEARGYILDQFTAISTNVLLKKNIININKDNKVDCKKNDAEVYEKYCEFIEDLAIYLDDHFRERLEERDAKIEPKHAEIFIFYDNKDNPGWRSKAAKIFEEKKSDLLLKVD